MIVGVPKESAPGERRVALVPELVARLTKAGLGVIVEPGAGTAAGFLDSSYIDVGARVESEVFNKADILLKVQPPTIVEVEKMKADAVLISFLQPYTSTAEIQALAACRITSFSMELMPRITRAQPMDALSAMSTVAGYKAVLLAASSLPKFFPLLMTAAGTVTPAHVFVIGAGVAGLQAIATAMRLGAVVEAYDTRPAVKEQVESLGAKFADLGLETSDGGQEWLCQSADRGILQETARDDDSIRDGCRRGHPNGADSRPARPCAHHRRDGSGYATGLRHHRPRCRTGWQLRSH